MVDKSTSIWTPPNPPTPTIPVEQQVQHLSGGGEGAVGAQEDGDVGGVLPPERRHHVLHQPLQRAGLDGPHLARLVQAEGGVRVHAQPPLPLTGRLVELHLPQRDGEDGVVLGLLADLLRRALPGGRGGGSGGEGRRKQLALQLGPGGLWWRSGDASRKAQDARRLISGRRNPVIRTMCVTQQRSSFLVVFLAHDSR